MTRPVLPYKVNKTFISFNAWSCRHWFIDILFSSPKRRKFFNFYVCLTEVEVFTWSFRGIQSRPHNEMFFFFLQRVQVVDSQCCELWNLTITELDSILCLLYRSNFVRQKSRPFHIILKWTRSYMNLSRIGRCEFSFIYWPWQFDFVNR